MDFIVENYGTLLLNYLWSFVILSVPCVTFHLRLRGNYGSNSMLVRSRQQGRMERCKRRTNVNLRKTMPLRLSEFRSRCVHRSDLCANILTYSNLMRVPMILAMTQMDPVLRSSPHLGSS